MVYYLWSRGYGPYERLNREYYRHELEQLLKFEGFDPTMSPTADVHINQASIYYSVEEMALLLRTRENDLVRHIFFKATLIKQGTNLKRPSWIYQSCIKDELV